MIDFEKRGVAVFYLFISQKSIFSQYVLTKDFSEFPLTHLNSIAHYHVHVHVHVHVHAHVTCLMWPPQHMCL